MFDHVGLVEAHHADRSLDLETVAIEVGAQNVEPWTDAEAPEGRLGARFTCERNDLVGVARNLAAAHWSVVTSEMTHQAKTPLELPADKRQQVVEFLNALDDHEDVHRVYAALK
jgi:transcriptional/translational regulatory protein YebC/TACO1